MPLPVKNRTLGLKLYTRIISYVQPTLLRCHSVRSNTAIVGSNSTTCITSKFMMHLQREIAEVHLLAQPPRQSVCLSLSSRDKYRTAELILTKFDTGNFCNFFPPFRYFGQNTKKLKGTLHQELHVFVGPPHAQLCKC